MMEQRAVHPRENRLTTLRKRLLRNVAGSAAIEFAVVAPLFAFVFGASIDLGVMLFTRFQLEGSVSAGISYAIAHADQVDGTNGAELAKSIAMMTTGSDRGNLTALVQINKGPQASYGGRTITLGGTASQANACYCPKGTADAVNWGSQQTCGTVCPDGGRAGRYVSVAVRQTYTPFFPMLNFAESGVINASAMVQTK